MFKQQNEQAGTKEAETIIGPSIKVKGNFHGHGNIVIEGVLEGSVKTANSLFIGTNAIVAASIEAKEATIGGEVTGNTKINGHLEITSSAKISGDIEASSLSIAKGAILNGKCTMTSEHNKTNSEKA